MWLRAIKLTGRAKIPFNGSGSYSLPYNWQTDAANGLNISSSRMQGQDADIAAALSLCLTKDGQQQIAASLNMGGFTLTNLANAVAQKQPVTVQDLQNGTPLWLGTASGTDTITAAANIAPQAYAAGQTFRFISAGPNATTAVTLNVNALGAKNITKQGATALAIGDIQGGEVVEVTYDGTQFQLQTPNFSLIPVSGRLLNIQVVTVSGTYTPTAGANSAIVFGAGSGGAAGGLPTTGTSQTAGSAGGSAGAFGAIRIPSGLTSQTVTIGAAGVGGSGIGGAGQACSWGALMVLPGGPGGYPGTATTALTAAQVGGPSAAPSGTGQFLFSSAGLSGAPGFSGIGIAGNPGHSLFGPGGFGSGGFGGSIGPNTPGANGQNGYAGGFVVFEYS